MSEYYDPDDDALPYSPLLQAVKPKVTPSPSPSPILTSTSLATIVSPPSSRRRKLRRKTRPTQGDFVLIRVMDPNRPDIAQSVGQRALRSEDGSDTEEDVMHDPSGTQESTTAGPAAVQPVVPTMDLRATAQKALDSPSASYSSPLHRDSAVDMDGHVGGFLDARRPSAASTSNGACLSTEARTSQTTMASPTSNRARHDSLTNGRPPSNPLATSPSSNLAHLAIPTPRPTQILPALQPPTSPLRDPSNPSPNAMHRLPSFRHLSEIASAASTSTLSPQDPSTHRPTNNSFPHTHSHAHRPSISSSTHSGQSPTLSASVSAQRTHSFSSALSPETPFPPLSATSPLTPASETGAGATPKSTMQDVFLRGGQVGTSLFGDRRASMVSATESARYAQGNASGAVGSPGGVSPGSTLLTPVESGTNGNSKGNVNNISGGGSHTLPLSALAVPGPGQGGPRMSIDGAMVASRTLPRPGPGGPTAGQPLSIQTTTTVPAQGVGYRCDFPGCNSAPFQTQYLLNSHANVHSQSRPHYCPVPGCSRAVGGKGFKRKNEMIRHGLVHDSPGYVCPFCNDREHRYPRPDNLQRHVRVHHVDKDKDDPALREVLAQRPEGGTRGRRRRGG